MPIVDLDDAWMERFARTLTRTMEEFYEAPKAEAKALEPGDELRVQFGEGRYVRLKISGIEWDVYNGWRIHCDGPLPKERVDEKIR